MTVFVISTIVYNPMPEPDTMLFDGLATPYKKRRWALDSIAFKSSLSFSFLTLTLSSSLIGRLGKMEVFSRSVLHISRTVFDHYDVSESVVAARSFRSTG